MTDEQVMLELLQQGYDLNTAREMITAYNIVAAIRAEFDWSQAVELGAIAL